MESYVERPPVPELPVTLDELVDQRVDLAELWARRWSRPPAAGADRAWTSPLLTADTGFRPAFDVAASVTDYVAWRSAHRR
ncbi:hypothetical protein AB0M20_16765 [Actinoplanes sp. NPDC051633]|uniref:hypothetical protein n=1 Tax=Actinoplanes sp. NPDC051633 TaxID=3155670 RepID=UPI003430F0B7